MKPWLSIFLLCACAAPQPPEGGEAVPASEVKTVAVVAPLSDAAKGLQLLRYVKKNNSFCYLLFSL
jgi:hypothetical protein